MLTLLTTIFLLILEALSWQEIIGGIVVILVGFFTYKSGILTSTNGLLGNRTVERDDALRERDKFKNECEELKSEMKVLRREVIQRIDINMQDQDTIRELKQRINDLE